VRGFVERLEAETAMRAQPADCPLTCVAVGAGDAVERMSRRCATRPGGEEVELR
jgi:actin-like ATPase involved in cell morphogenesis